MKRKPSHLRPEHATQYGDPSVVAAYRHRPPWPRAAAEFVAGLVRAGPAAVLEVGCGPGRFTRLLAPLVASVDAVDPSAGMLAEARRLAGAECANVRWIHAPIETAPLRPPYALAVAAQSLHWTDWDVALPRLARALAPGGRLAMVVPRIGPVPWEEGLEPLLARHTTVRADRVIDFVAELVEGGLYTPEGTHEVGPLPHACSVGEYVESFHSASGFSRDRMGPAAAAAFDAELSALVRPHAPDGRLAVPVTTVIDHGRPRAPPAA